MDFFFNYFGFKLPRELADLIFDFFKDGYIPLIIDSLRFILVEFTQQVFHALRVIPQITEVDFVMNEEFFDFRPHPHL